MMYSRITQLTACLLLIAAGYGLRAWLHTCPEPEPHTCPVKIEYRDQVKTEIAYVPKETIIYRDANGNEQQTAEKTDLDITIGKPELAVKLNGKEFTVQKAENEKYIFDKNKINFTQQSRTELEINVPTIDKTKHWQIGIGASNDGVVGLVGFPIRGNIGGWVVGNRETIMAGVNIKL